MVTDLVRHELRETKQGPSRELTCHFVGGALLSILTWWLEAEPDLTAEQVDDLFQGLVTTGLAL
jgi:hypothetical protein